MLPPATVDLDPEDLKGLRRFLAEMVESKGLDEALDTVLLLVARLLRDQAKMTARLRDLLRGRAGGGTERISPDQLDLWKKALEEAVEASAPAAVEEKKRGTPRRLALPAHLPRQTVPVLVEAPFRVCSVCGADKVCIGHERSEVLEMEPPRLVVQVIEREQLACKECGQDGVVTAPAVAKPLDGGMVGPGLLADVVIRKAVDHTPIHRMLGIYRRLGVDLAESTVYGWWNQVGEKLEPVADGIQERMLASHLVQADDTGLRVLDEDTPDGSRLGHMWGAIGDGTWACYHFTPTWKADEMEAFLGARTGWLQGDGYAGYDRLYRKPAPAIEVGCWSHARRYYVKAEENGDKRAREALVHIGAIFTVDREGKAKGLSPPELLVLRNEKARPALDRLWKWVARVAPNTTPSSRLGKANTYATNQRVALERFLEDGRLPLENGAAELLARHIAVGRKNWLHCGSERGAQRLATINTVMVTARMHGADLSGGLAFVLDCLARDPTRAVRDLLPDRWPKAQIPRR